MYFTSRIVFTAPSPYNDCNNNSNQNNTHMHTLTPHTHMHVCTHAHVYILTYNNTKRAYDKQGM